MVQPEEGPDQRYQGISRLTSAVVVVLLLTHIVLAWIVRAQAITTGNDDALYLLLARSLRSFHYLDSHILGSPMHAQYPPGYPAFLAIFGGNFTAAIAGGILVSAIGLLLAYDLSRRVIGAVPALLVLAALCVNPHLVDWAGSLRSESVFMTAGLAAIWCASRDPMSTGWMVAAGAFAIYAAMVRSAGVALVVALLVVWLLQRRFRAALVFAGAAGLFVGGWLVLTALAPGKFSGRSYAAALQRAETTPTAMDALTNRLEASLTYIYKNIPAALSVPSVESTWVDNAFWIILLTVGVGAGLYLVWKKFPVVVAYLIAYAIILILYPFKLTRFIFPIVPLIVLVATAGLVFLVRRFAGRGTLTVTALFCIPLIAASISRVLPLMQAAALCTSAEPLGPTTCSTAEQRSFFAAAAYAREQTASDASFATLKEATFALLSGRQVQHPERLIRQDSLRLPENMKAAGLDYIVLTPLHDSKLSRYLVPRCDELEIVQRFPAETFILRFAPRADSTRAACPVLQYFATNYSTDRAGMPPPDDPSTSP